MGDQSALHQPKVMANATIDAVVHRCLDHARIYDIGDFRFVFHGGEPLLAGLQKFKRLIETAHRLESAYTVRSTFSLQTNATLLTEEWCTQLAGWGVSVGVSIDGPERVNDRRRVTHRGEGSYGRVLKGWRTAQRHGLQPGILTVIDPTTSPDEAYAHLKELAPRRVDFLLPEANHQKPPEMAEACRSETPFADWLLTIFRLWNAEEKPPPFGIRIFEQIIASTLGVTYPSDALGRGENEIVVIDTDGEIGPVDVLRASLPGAGRTGFNVHSHDIDAAMRHHLLRRYHFSNLHLCSECSACPINQICGGGYFSHRYSAERGFDNPSVYCKDLTKLITTIRDATLSMLPPEALRQADLSPLSFQDAVAMRARSSRSEAFRSVSDR